MINKVSPAGINTQGYKQNKQGKKIALSLAALAAADTAILYTAAKKGTFNHTPGGIKIVEAAKSVLRKPATAIFNGVNYVSNKFQLAAKGNPNLSALTDKPKAIVKNVKSLFASAKNFAVSKLNLQKFNPDLAPAAEKAAETFNNFVK